jgi:hypothetical protein
MKMETRCFGIAGIRIQIDHLIFFLGWGFGGLIVSLSQTTMKIILVTFLALEQIFNFPLFTITTLLQLSSYGD